MATKKNNVNQLTWNVPITNPNGTPTNEFMRKWLQQATQNSSVTDLSTAANVSAVLDLISAAVGSLLVRGATAWQGLASPGDATKYLNGAASPTYASVRDSDLSTSDITTNNVSITKHGFAPKAPNDVTKFLDGTGNYSAPAGGNGGASSIYLDGTDGWMALVDATTGLLILDPSGDAIYVKDPVLPVAMIPDQTFMDTFITSGSAVGLASTIQTDLMSLALPPGIWEVSGTLSFSPGVATVTTQALVFVNDGTLPAKLLAGKGKQVYSFSTTAGAAFAYTSGQANFVNAGPGNLTIFLSTIPTFGGGTLAGYGYLQAQRIGN